jgi:hypothetical protein
MERARIFFPTAPLLVGHESRFAPSSRLAFGKNLACERRRSFRAGHYRIVEIDEQHRMNTHQLNGETSAEMNRDEPPL